MAFAQRIITSNSAGDQEFTFTFPFIKEEHIKVFVNFVEKAQGTGSNEFQVITNTTPNKVRLGTALTANNTRVEIRRVSSINTVLVDFQDGSTLTATDLDTNSKQSLFIAQELDDAQKQGLSIDLTTGRPSLNNQLLTNVLDPISAQDAVTKAYLERTGSITSTQIADGTIVNADINTSADIAVSKLDHGTARQILQTNAAGNGVEFTSNVDIPGTLDVTGNVDLDANLNVDGTTTLDGTTVDGVLDVNGSATIDAITIDSTSVSSSGHLALNGTRIDLNSNTDINLDGDLKVRPDGTTTKFSVLDSVIYAYENLKPGTTDNQGLSTHDLGASLARWNKVYAETTVTNKFSGSGIVDTGVSSNSDQVYSCKRAEERFYGKDTLGEIQSGETWSSADDKVATTAAIDARIIDLVDDVGGFVPIANETSFPSTNPDINTSNANKGGTIVSVKAASTNLTAQSGTTLTIANGRGTGNAVIITGVSATIPSGFGFLVETTATDHTYAFHRLVPKATEVTAVAGNATNINTVATNISNVNAVGTNISNVNSVAGNASNINSAVSNASNINAAVSNATNINTVATNNTNINTVAGISANVTTVANDGTDIGTVATNIANVNTVAGISSDVTTVAGISSNVTTVANNNSNVTTVAGNNANITTVANNNSNVTTVANANSNIATVASAISNVNTTAGSISNVNTVAGSISNVNAVGTNINDVTNASNYLNNFLQLYLGEASSNPTVDSLGNAVTEGDLYFNNVDKRVRVFNGSVFQNLGEGLIEVAKFATAAFNTLYTASAGSNSIDLGSLAISGAAFSNEAIATNRVSLAKGSGTFNLGGI